MASKQELENLANMSRPLKEVFRDSKADSFEMWHKIQEGPMKAQKHRDDIQEKEDDDIDTNDQPNLSEATRSTSIQTSAAVIFGAASFVENSTLLSNNSPSTTITNQPNRVPNPSLRRQKHIMISYSRSCSTQCNLIRKYLQSKNYVVWMDVEQLRGNFIKSLADAISNSYIALICVNRAYQHSYWCKKEVKFLAKKNVPCIPCFMEKPFVLGDWLDSLIGSYNQVDFSTDNSFNEKMEALIKEITECERLMASTPPRRSAPDSPIDESLPMMPLNSTALTRGEVAHIIETFQRWVQRHREVLRRTDRKQAEQLVDELSRSLQSDDNFQKQTKEEFLENLSRLLINPAESMQNEGHLMKVAAGSLIMGVMYFMLVQTLQTIYEE